MAYSLIPSARWQEILDIEDEVEQGIAATKYVCELEEENRKLKDMKTEIEWRTKKNLIDQLMLTKPFKEWLARHDGEIHDVHKDWYGLQEGF